MVAESTKVRDKRPNIVWLNTHDVSARHLGCYGDPYARTPNLDRIAGEGVRYTSAFTAGPICSPSRTSIFTSMHPTTLGTHHHRSFAVRPPFAQLLPAYLTSNGYASTQINSDINTYIDSDEWASLIEPDELWQQRPTDKPFFAVFSFAESHASTFKKTPEEVRRHRSDRLADSELHDPDHAPVPSFLPDTPLFRERMALFYPRISV